jgi:D-serine deaminase-like pyridoxal phosphate-dependent protein
VADRYAELCSAIEGRSLPLSLLDLDALDHNAHVLLARAQGLPIRLCSKSLRSVFVLRHLQQLSPHFRGILCYSAREAAYLHTQGFRDLLVAYPSVDPGDVRAGVEACAEGADLCLMVDDAAQLPPWIEAARAARVRLRVCIDLDLSSHFGVLYFGVRRSPLRTPEAAIALAEHIAAAEDALELAGLMGYEAQIAGIQDDVPDAPVKSRLLRVLKQRSTREVHARRAAVVALLRARGFSLGFVNGGGTGSLDSSARDRSVTELSAGSGLYAPALFDHFRDLSLRPALLFALGISRRPAPDLVTCNFGGYVASGPPGADRLPRPAYPEGMRLLEHEGAGEVQTPVQVPRAAELRLGAPLFFRHAKAGELAERFQRFYLLRDGQIIDDVTTYRGDGQCFF